MNYRELQLRQMHKKELFQLQEQITNLENSVDYQNVQDLEEEVSKRQTWLNDTFKLLDIKKLSELQKLLGGQTLKALVKENSNLKNTDNNQKINNLENNLTDTKAELKKIEQEKATLLKIKMELEEKITSAGYQLDGLIANIEKGLITDCKKEVLISVKTIKSLLSREK